MLFSLIWAWIFTWFNLDEIIIAGINQLCNTNYTTAVYWLIFLVLGVILRIVREIK